MRNQLLNPAYQRFAHHLSSEGRYAAAHVDVFWNRDPDYRIKDVEVVFIPRGVPDLPPNKDDRVFWQSYSRYNKQWESDLGNSCAGWLKDGQITPESTFGSLLADGFSSATELKRALEEFGHIEECAWAREMLRGFVEE